MRLLPVKIIKIKYYFLNNNFLKYYFLNKTYNSLIDSSQYQIFFIHILII